MTKPGTVLTQCTAFLFIRTTRNHCKWVNQKRALPHWKGLVRDGHWRVLRVHFNMQKVHQLTEDGKWVEIREPLLP